MRILMVFRNHGLICKHRCQSKGSENYFVTRIILCLVGKQLTKCGEDHPTLTCKSHMMILESEIP